MSIKGKEDYEKEIANLKSEISRLESQVLVNRAGGKTFSDTGASFTIVGLEEMVLLVNDQGLISFANSGMTQLLGAKDKKELLKSRLSDWDKYPLGDGFLTTLFQTVKSTDQVCVLEQSFSAFPPGLLLAKPSIGSEVILRFVCCPVKNQVQIVIQDVTSNRWLEKTFSKYVSSKVIELLRTIPAADLLKVERRVVTVLFADLRGFTKVSQEIEPEEVCEMVNSYLSRMVECVEKYDGTVDKFVGDEIMAAFGAPLPQQDHALRALLCAVAMIESHKAWQIDREKMGLNAPPVGIGIVTGEVIVGNIGTEKQMDYTVLGHSVNLAARLCGAAEGMEILTVPETHKSAQKALKQGVDFKNMPHLKFEPKGKLDLKNVKAPVEVLKVTVKMSG